LNTKKCKAALAHWSQRRTNDFIFI